MSQEPTTLDPVLPPPAGLRSALPLVEELPPGLSPWEAAQRLASWSYLLFLDSAAVDSPLSRYSFICSDPFQGLLTSKSVRDPFALLARQLARFPSERLPGLPPFQGGAAGLFCYDLCHAVERLPWPRYEEFSIPTLAVGFYDWVVAFDHSARRAWLISTGFPETDPVRRRER